MTRRWYSYLVAASLAFLLVYLYRSDYLVPVRFHSPPALALSVLFLIAGFLCQATAWWATVNETEWKAGLSVCVAGSGMAVFTRYIPGKVFTVLGRALYLAEQLGYPAAKVSMISLSAQLISLWVGLALGVVGLLFAGGGLAWKGPMAAAWALLTLSIFSDFFHRLAERLLRLVLGRELSIPRLRLRSIVKVLPWYLAAWLSWATGFHLLLMAFIRSDLPLVTGLGFALATTIGIATLFAPGGLGVREGALAAFLLGIGLTGPESVSASVYSRLWFLLGEVVFFAVGFAASRRHR